MRKFMGFLAMISLGCSEPPRELEVLYSLAALLPVAEVALEQPVLDLGGPDSRGSLRAGWSYNQRGRDGSTSVWAVGARSTLEVYMAEPADLELIVTASSFPFDDPSPQRAQVHVNDVPVGTLDLDATPGEHRLLIPEAATVDGANQLRFEWARHRESGPPLAGGDRRRHAARVDRIQLRGLAEPEPPSLTVSAALRLSAGSELSYYLDLDPGARLDATALSAETSDLQLELLFQRPGEERRVLTRWRPSNRPLALELPATGGPARLTLRAVGGSEPWLGALHIEEPVIVGPRTEDNPPPTRTSAPAESAERPNVVLWVVDTLRADRLGCHGYDRDTSPNIDAFAAQAVVFEDAIAQSSWTKPTVASLFTGLEPTSHGVNRRDVGLDDKLVTMAELFAEAGYLTAGFVGNAYLTRSAGYGQGFETFETLTDEDADGMARRALDWIDQRGSSESPFLLLTHTMEPHAPYSPTAELRHRFAPSSPPLDWGGVEHLRALASRSRIEPDVVASLLELYDAEVAWNDRGFGALVDGLGERGLFEDSIVVFVADHGEAFEERGIIGHGWDLHTEAVHVPMILRTPDSEPGRRVESTVRQTDLLPTLLEASGIAAPAGTEGRSLLSRLTEQQPAEERPTPAFSFQTYDGRDAISVTTEKWKLIEPLTRRYGARTVLYHRPTDPGERADVSARHPVISGYLRSLALIEMERRSADGPAIEIDGATRKELEALGYVLDDVEGELVDEAVEG